MRLPPIVVGERYGKWLVLEVAPWGKKGAKPYLCRCDCGVVERVKGTALRRRRFGCHHQTNYHGLSRTRKREYNTWKAIQRRCTKPRDLAYSNYGGRGIKLHEPWMNNPTAFIAYLDKVLGPRPKGKTLDRIDNNGNYIPGNLKWSTTSEQQQNRRRIRRTGIKVLEISALLAPWAPLDPCALRAVVDAGKRWQAPKT